MSQYSALTASCFQKTHSPERPLSYIEKLKVRIFKSVKACLGFWPWLENYVWIFYQSIFFSIVKHILAQCFGGYYRSKNFKSSESSILVTYLFPQNRPSFLSKWHWNSLFMFFKTPATINTYTNSRNLTIAFVPRYFIANYSIFIR